MIQIVDAVQALKSVVQMLRKSDPSFPSISFSSTSNVEQFLNENQIREHLNNCLSVVQGSSCPAADSEALCNNLIKLQKSVYPAAVTDSATLGTFSSESSQIAAKLQVLSNPDQTGTNTIIKLNKGLPVSGTLWSRLRLLQDPTQNNTFANNTGSGVAVQTSNYTAAGPDSSMDFSLMFP